MKNIEFLNSDIRVTSHSGLPGTVSVLPQKVPCPRKPLSSEQTGTVDHPEVESR